MARRLVKYAVVNAANDETGPAPPAFRTTWHSKEDLKSQLMQRDVPSDGTLYFWNGEFWLDWNEPEELPGPQVDPMKVKIVHPYYAGKTILHSMLWRYCLTSKSSMCLMRRLLLQITKTCLVWLAHLVALESPALLGSAH